MARHYKGLWIGGLKYVLYTDKNEALINDGSTDKKCLAIRIGGQPYYFCTNENPNYPTKSHLKFRVNGKTKCVHINGLQKKTVYYDDQAVNPASTPYNQYPHLYQNSSFKIPYDVPEIDYYEDDYENQTKRDWIPDENVIVYYRDSWEVWYYKELATGSVNINSGYKSIAQDGGLQYYYDLARNNSQYRNYLNSFSSSDYSPPSNILTESPFYYAVYRSETVTNYKTVWYLNGTGPYDSQEEAEKAKATWLLVFAQQGNWSGYAVAAGWPITSGQVENGTSQRTVFDHWEPAASGWVTKTPAHWGPEYTIKVKVGSHPVYKTVTKYRDSASIEVEVPI